MPSETIPFRRHNSIWPISSLFGGPGRRGFGRGVFRRRVGAIRLIQTHTSPVSRAKGWGRVRQVSIYRAPVPAEAGRKTDQSLSIWKVCVAVAPMLSIISLSRTYCIGTRVFSMTDKDVRCEAVVSCHHSQRRGGCRVWWKWA